MNYFLYARSCNLRFFELGLKHFYKEHDNVTNMFVGDSASFEMSVLDSLEPCVRCLSFIGALQDVASMQDFLNFLETKFENIMLSDFKVVQKSVSSVRDWFTSGMDDIATTFSTFERVYSTGEYFICDARNGSDLDRLCLRYRNRDKKTTDTMQQTSAYVIMERETLNDFVQHLGFIQHESESISERVESFIDQHQTLVRAAENLLLMCSVGFPVADLLSFSYKVSERHLSDAKEVLLESNEKWLQCESWLEKIRNDYYLSLLFWMEELKEIHMYLTQIESNKFESETGTTLLHGLVCAASRIVPAEFNTRHDSTCDAAKSAIVILHSDTAYQEQSWILIVSKFLDLLNEEIGSPRNGNYKSPNNIPVSQIVVHTLNCDEAVQKDAVINLLKHIYVVR